jgi:holliday junction DNA helicase RuvA
MIAHLRGKLIFKEPCQAIVEAAGVGYDVTISMPTFSAPPPQPRLAAPQATGNAENR